MSIRPPEAPAPVNGSLPPTRRHPNNGSGDDGYQHIADSRIAASEAEMHRLARRGLKTVNRMLGGGGQSLGVRLALATVFVTVLAALDFPLFQWLFGQTPFWTWLTAAGTNGLLIVACHIGLAKALFDISRAGKFEHGLKWRFEVAAAIFITATVLACSGAASWARATALNVDTTAVLGARSPGLVAAFVFFLGLHGALFSVGALTGFQEEKRRRASEDEFELSIPLRVALCGVADEILQRLYEIAAVANQTIASDARHYRGVVPADLSVCAVPPELITVFQNIKDTYGWTADDAEAE